MWLNQKIKLNDNQNVKIYELSARCEDNFLID